MGKKETDSRLDLHIEDLPERTDENRPKIDPWPWQSRKGPKLGKRHKRKQRHFKPRGEGNKQTKRRHRREIEPDEDF